MICDNEMHGESFSLYEGDCVEITRQLPDHSVGFGVWSPPFSNLFTYSSSERDFGNCSSDEEFFESYRFLARELIRIVKPGRLIAVHCSDMPFTKWKDGVIGINPFSDMLSAVHREAGFILHCRITVRRDPVTEMQRTKSLGLLYKQIKKDSCRSRVGMPDYILVFRAPGENAEPVGHAPEDFPVDLWQQWAEPVWMDIRQTNTLNVQAAREVGDERHICPLQLDIIERLLVLWSNPGDVVLSPFMGIGSEGVMSVKLKRRFLGVELKPSYYKAACKYIASAEANAVSLFDGLVA